MPVRAVLRGVLAFMVAASVVATSYAQLPSVVRRWDGKVGGLVLDPAGRPVDGVRVTSHLNGDDETDNQGRFLLHLSEFVRFSKTGYGPVTFAADALPDVVTLAPAVDAQRPVRECSPSLARQGRRQSLPVWGQVPRAARILKTDDIHGSRRAIDLGRPSAYMVIANGIMYDSAYVSPRLYAGRRRMAERDWVLPDGRVLGEYRGVDARGLHFRKIADIQLSITYEGVPARVARRLDMMFDTLCSVPRLP